MLTSLRDIIYNSMTRNKIQSKAMKNTRVLTGITTTGTPHLGNYIGAIKPAIQASQSPNLDSFFFLADYLSLIHI